MSLSHTWTLQAESINPIYTEMRNNMHTLLMAGEGRRVGPRRLDYTLCSNEAPKSKPRAASYLLCAPITGSQSLIPGEAPTYYHPITNALKDFICITNLLNFQSVRNRASGVPSYRPVYTYPACVILCWINLIEVQLKSSCSTAGLSCTRSRRMVKSQQIWWTRCD